MENPADRERFVAGARRCPLSDPGANRRTLFAACRWDASDERVSRRSGWRCANLMIWPRATPPYSRRQRAFVGRLNLRGRSRLRHRLDLAGTRRASSLAAEMALADNDLGLLARDSPPIPTPGNHDHSVDLTHDLERRARWSGRFRDDFGSARSCFARMARSPCLRGGRAKAAGLCALTYDGRAVPTAVNHDVELLGG